MIGITIILYYVIGITSYNELNIIIIYYEVELAILIYYYYVGDLSYYEKKHDKL